MLRAELAHLFGRRRVQALLVILALVPIGVVVAIRLSGGPGGGDGPAFLGQITNNGVFAALAALTITLPIFLPLAVAIVAGDAIAGEASLGTLRYLLVRPAGRSRLLGVKALAVVAFCVAAPFVVAAAGLIVGSVLFPVGRVTTLSGDTLSIASGAIRIAGAAGLVGVSLLGLAAIGLFASTLTDIPIGAIAATLGVVILAGVLGTIPQVSAIHPWLLTNGWLSYGDLLRSHVTWTAITRNVALQAGYVLVFGAAAWARLTTRDVLA
ncbi:MAG: putative transporter integral rane subunit [Acidimicrobiales bacterium]|jgi:ABC-2 type transport system permease protein|nr:putative transporter integral rane subunit [Acidimicrobiales bacterium]